MKKIAAYVMLALFALNSLLGIAGGVLLCMHSHGSHIELASAHSCAFGAISKSGSPVLEQENCGHLQDFVIVADGAAGMPKLPPAGTAVSAPVFAEVFCEVFAEYSFVAENGADKTFKLLCDPPERFLGAHSRTVFCRFII